MKDLLDHLELKNTFNGNWLTFGRVRLEGLVKARSLEQLAVLQKFTYDLLKKLILINLTSDLVSAQVLELMYRKEHGSVETLFKDSN